MNARPAPSFNFDNETGNVKREGASGEGYFVSRFARVSKAPSVSLLPNSILSAVICPGTACAIAVMSVGPRPSRTPLDPDQETRQQEQPQPTHRSEDRRQAGHKRRHLECLEVQPEEGRRRSFHQ